MKAHVSVLAAALAAIASMFSMSGSAQNARVDIPFDFFANHQALPAGCYKVELQSSSYIHLVDCSTGKVVGLMARTTSAYHRVQRGKLVFRDTIRGYRLTQIHFAHINMQSDLAVQPKVEDVVARGDNKKANEIAMK